MTNAPHAVVALARGLPEPIEAAPEGLPKDIMGEPCTYWWKPILKPGVYAHPDKKYGTIEFTRDDLVTADNCTREWIADGGKPAIPLHSHRGKNVGWLVNTRWDGQQLWGLHQFIGDDARREAARNETSVGFTRNYTDPTTHKVFPALIEHNALVPNAVASGLGHFVALSRADGGPALEMPVYVFTAAEGTRHMTPAQLEMSRKILGDTVQIGDAEVPVSEENAVDLLIQAAESATRYFGEVQETQTELSRATDEVADLKDRLAQKMVEMSRATTPHKPSASELHWASKYVASVRDAAVRSGAITPAIADKAEARFLSAKPVKFETITLSREVQDDDHKLADGFARLLDFYETVQGNAPTPPVGEITGSQAIAMNRTTPDDGAPGQVRKNPYKGEIEAQNAAATAKAK